MRGRAGTIVVFAIAPFAVGCASGPFGLEVRHPGRVDPVKDEQVAEKAQELPWEGKYEDIEVTTEVPSGITLAGGKVEADPERFVYVGSARSFMEDTRQVAFAKSMFWYESMHPSHSSARDTACKIQWPLRTLTLGIWGLVSPTSWFCYVLYTKKLSTNLAIHTGEMRRVARVLGADLVILESVEAETQSYTTGYGWNTGTGHESVPGASATGYFFIDKRRAQPPSGKSEAGEVETDGAGDPLGLHATSPASTQARPRRGPVVIE
jgi:hypothetical protein